MTSGGLSFQCLIALAIMNALVARYANKITVRITATLSDSLLQEDAFSPSALHQSLQINRSFDLSRTIDFQVKRDS